MGKKPEAATRVALNPKKLLRAVALSFPLVVAFSICANAGDWFAEGGLGGLYGRFAHVEYDDPVGSLFTPNARNGTRIVPQNLTSNSWSGAAAASVGYLFDDRYFLRATYRYFGTRSVTANGIFFYSPTDTRQISPSLLQTMTASAHGVFLGIGIECDLGKDWFIDAALEIGMSVVRAGGDRDVNTVIAQPFPSKIRLNPAYGVGLIVGRKFSANLAVEIGLNWNHLGRADTGAAPDIGGGPNYVTTPGIRTDASMTGKVDAASILLGFRYFISKPRSTS